MLQQNVCSYKWHQKSNGVKREQARTQGKKKIAVKWMFFPLVKLHKKEVRTFI